MGLGYAFRHASLCYASLTLSTPRFCDTFAIMRAASLCNAMLCSAFLPRNTQDNATRRAVFRADYFDKAESAGADRCVYETISRSFRSTLPSVRENSVGTSFQEVCYWACWHLAYGICCARLDNAIVICVSCAFATRWFSRFC